MFNRPIFGDLLAEKIQASVQTVADTFGLPWLKTAGNHALQRLWTRGDWTSTLELVTLATDLTTMQALDATWLKNQVKHAKSADAGTSRGALFEIRALSMLHGPTQRVAPAKSNQPGYDGLLTSSDGKKLRISIKHYGASRRLREFEKNAKAVEQLLLGLLKQAGFMPCQLALDFPARYPEESEWKVLRDSLPDWFGQHHRDPFPFFAYVEPIDLQRAVETGNAREVFRLMVGRIKPPQLLDFHPGFTSYGLIASSVYHPNEIQNFYSKLDEGCANLSKHATVETPDVANALFVHLPETVTIAQAEQWVLAYFKDKPEKPISGVFLYQPLIVQAEESK